MSFFRKRLDHLARKLWSIFSIFRLRFSSQHPKKTGDTGRRIQSRSAKPSYSTTTVICASRLPPSPLTPIAGGDTPSIASPSEPISIEVRQPTILNPEDILEESHESNSDRLGGAGYFLGRRRSNSRSPDFTHYHDEPSPIRVVPHLNREESISSSPVTPSRPDSILSSRYSSHTASQYGGSRPGYWSESHRLPSGHPYHSSPSLNGAESAARGYLHERPSPRPSSPAQSVAGSVTSRVYRGSRITTRVRRPSPMAHTPRRGDRPPTPASVRPSVHETHPDVPVPELPQPEPRTAGSLHRDRNSVAVSPDPSTAPPPEGVLRPAIGIDRYEKKKMVVIEDVIKHHVCLPVTTKFVRWVFAFLNGVSDVHLPYAAASLFLKIGFPSCIPMEPCTGSTRKM